MKNCDHFLINGPNIDFWNSLEPPLRGDANEAQKSMSESLMTKLRYISL